MSDLRATDTLSAKEGKAYVTIDGIMHEAFYAKNIEATITKNKVEVKIVGQRMTKHKTVGITGAGTFNIFYVSPFYRQMMEKYKDTGVDTYFTMTINSEDPESTVGTNSVTLYDVNIDSSLLAKFDQDGDILTEDVPFTFDDYNQNTNFNESPQH